MALEKKNFVGGLNSDAEDRLIPNGDYRYSLNVRSSKSDGANEGAIENTKGNELIKVDLPAGYSKVIGALDSVSTNTVIYCLYNSFGHHSIYEFDASNDSVTLLLRNIKLNFQADKYINDMSIIGGVLFFNDRFNEPGSLNIARAKSNTYPIPFEENFLRVIVNAPGCPAEVEYGDEPSVSVNSIRGKLYQVRYKWVYLDNEESAWSPISKVPLPIIL